MSWSSNTSNILFLRPCASQHTVLSPSASQHTLCADRRDNHRRRQRIGIGTWAAAPVHLPSQRRKGAITSIVTETDPILRTHITNNSPSQPGHGVVAVCASDKPARAPAAAPRVVRPGRRRLPPPSSSHQSTKRAAGSGRRGPSGVSPPTALAHSVTERAPRRPEVGERRASPPRCSGDGDDSKRGYAAHERPDGGGGDHARGDVRTRPAWSPGTRRRRQRQNAWRTGGGESARGYARTCSAGPP
uniref:Uncharacterized protein n=1 Tax=Zea mays TaxID=4577 RepID=A0A804RGA7_MAIZE